MKILGKKSLSSAIEKGLVVLLILGIFITISVGMWIILDWEKWMGFFLTKTIFIAYLSSLPVLIMVVEFIKIFQNLKNEKAFDKQNLKFLKVSYIASFTICAIYLINTIILLLDTTARRGIITCNREPNHRTIRKRDRLLYQTLAEGPSANDDAAVPILDRSGDNLAG